MFQVLGWLSSNSLKAQICPQMTGHVLHKAVREAVTDLWTEVRVQAEVVRAAACVSNIPCRPLNGASRKGKPTRRWLDGSGTKGIYEFLLCESDFTQCLIPTDFARE
jgi:hypothetical protein